MPLPMVHLAVARKIALSYERLKDCPEYYLGSISPDAIHMRKNSSRNDKCMTHLKDENGWQDNAINFIKSHSLDDDISFYLGYGVHLLTDIIWYESIFSDFKSAYLKDSLPDKEMLLWYYNDTDVIDIRLYNELEDRPLIWSLLKEAKYNNVDNLLSSEEIKVWNNHVHSWFDDKEIDKYRPQKYISYDEVKTFMDEAVDTIHSLIDIYMK